MRSRELCADRRPHLPHQDVVGLRLREIDCPGIPEPDSVEGRVWRIVHDGVTAGLRLHASGLDDGVAAAVARLRAEGLIGS